MMGQGSEQLQRHCRHDKDNHVCRLTNACKSFSPCSNTEEEDDYTEEEDLEDDGDDDDEGPQELESEDLQRIGRSSMEASAG
jgi:hypothetical protein